MKSFACIVVLALVAAASADGLTDEQKTKLNAISKECQEKSGVTQEVIDKLRKGEYTKDDKTDAHLLCVVQKTGVLTEAGEIKTEIFKEKLNQVVKDETKVNTIVTKCAVKKDSPTETAKAILKCLKEEKDASGKTITFV